MFMEQAHFHLENALNPVCQNTVMPKQILHLFNSNTWSFELKTYNRKINDQEEEVKSQSKSSIHHRRVIQPLKQPRIILTKVEIKQKV